MTKKKQSTEAAVREIRRCTHRKFAASIAYLFHRQVNLI
jgi:hypothetical protein